MAVLPKLCSVQGWQVAQGGFHMPSCGCDCTGCWHDYSSLRAVVTYAPLRGMAESRNSKNAASSGHTHPLPR